MSDETFTAPEKELTLTTGRKLKMPYALLMDICRFLPDPASAVSLVMSDPITQDYIVRRMLTPLERAVKTDDDLIAPGEVDIDIDDVEALLSWVVQHVLYFFVKRSLGMVRAGEKYKQAFPVPQVPAQLTPSTSGSED